jgi:hypothetical protein
LEFSAFFTQQGRNVGIAGGFTEGVGNNPLTVPARNHFGELFRNHHSARRLRPGSLAVTSPKLFISFERMFARAFIWAMSPIGGIAHFFFLYARSI